MPTHSPFCYATCVMGYTDEELSAAIEKIVRSSVRFQYDQLGIRRTDVSFNDLQDAAAGIFVRFDSSPYYLARIAADRLNELVERTSGVLQEFIDTARATHRFVAPVERLNNLVQARVALDALSVAAGGRSRSFNDIEDVPAFQRFEKNTDTWLKREGGKIKSGGDVVKTPQQAQGQLRGKARELRELHDELLRRTRLLKDCIADYENLNLPATLVQSIIDNSRDVLQGRIEELEALNPAERIDKIRDVTLDVLASRSVVRGFGSLTPPGLFARLSGEGAPYYDSVHPANPAELLADLPEPYNVFETQNRLALVLDGDLPAGVPTVVLQLPASFVPFVDSTARTTVTLTVASEFSVQVVGSGQPASSIDIPAASYDIYELRDGINADMGLTPAEALVRLVGGITALAEGLGGAPYEFRVFGSSPLPTPAPPTWVESGVVVGNYVVVVNRDSGMFQSVFEVTGFNSSNYVMECTLLSGSSAVEAEVTLEIGAPGLQVLSIAIALGSANNALNGLWSLKLEDDVDNSLFNIGLQTGVELTSRQTSAADVVELINISSTARDLLQEARVECESVFEADIHVGGARTDPNDSTVLYIYAARGEATITSITFPGAALIVMSLDPEVDWSGVEVGAALVIRETEVVGDVNRLLTVLIVDIENNELTAVTTIGGQPTQDGLPIVIEVAPLAANSVSENFTRLIINEGTAADGEYEVGPYSSADGGRLSLPEGLPFRQNLTFGGLPLFFENVRWGHRRVLFRSLNNTLDSYVRVIDEQDDLENPPAVIPVENSVRSEFFNAAGKESYASTEWYGLPAKTVQVEEGDQLEIHNSDPLVPSSMHTVVAGEEGFRILRVTPVIEEPQSAVSLNVNSRVPFARVRKFKKQNFEEMSELLEAWLDRPEANSLSYFRSLDIAINTVVSSRRPTAAQVGNLVNRLQALQQALATDSDSLQAALGIYTAKIVEQVDRLLQGYRDKGADRAADLLEEGQFSSFFGLTMDGASYGGRLQETMKAAARELPIRKVNRQSELNAGGEQIIAQYEDVDFEYVTEEVRGVDRIDIPEANDVLPGSLPTP